MKHGMLLFSDLHLRPETEEVCFQVLAGVLQEAIKHNVEAIGFLGDFWHLRYQVPVYLLNRVVEWVHEVKKHGFDLVLLPGNHDQINELGENALSIFVNAGARVFTKPAIDKWGAWMPYRKNKAEVAETLKFFADHGEKILFGHLPVLGALMNNKMEDKDGLSPDHFMAFERVLLGHYHKQQDFLDGRVSYIGSPWQTRADEYGQKKGFALWQHACGVMCGCIDTGVQNWQLTRLDQHFGKHFHRFEVTSPEDFSAQLILAQPTSEDVVTLVAPTKDALDACLKIANKAGYQHINGNATDLAVPQPRYGFQKGTTLTEYASAWAQEKGKDIAPHGELMSVWTEISG